MFAAKLNAASAVVQPSTNEDGDGARMCRFEESKKYQDYKKKLAELKNREKQSSKKSNKVQDQSNSRSSVPSQSNHDSEDHFFEVPQEEEPEDIRLSFIERFVTGPLANGKFQGLLRYVNILVKITAALIYLVRVYDEDHHYNKNGDYKNCWTSQGFYIGSKPDNVTNNIESRDLGAESIDNSIISDLGDAFLTLFQKTGLNNTWAYITSFEYMNFESIPDEDKGEWINPNWNANDDFNWEVIFYVCRSESFYTIQLSLAMFNMAYFLFYHTLYLYWYDFTKVKEEISNNIWLVILELVNTIPFLLSFMGMSLAKYIWLPIFLNIWIVKEEVKDTFVGRRGSNHTRTWAFLIVDMICNVLTTALFINHIERAGKYPAHFNIMNSIWFLFVTVLTIGYGDIVPTTGISKIVMMISFSLLYKAVVGSYGQLVALFEETKATGGEFIYNTGEDGKAKKSADFVIFCTTTFSEDITADFMNEFYSVEENRAMKVVILNATDKTSEIDRAIAKMRNANEIPGDFVNYYKGSLILESDLERISAKYAKACFIVTHRSSHDAIQQDQRTVMRAMHLKTYAPNVKIYVHLLKIQSKLHVEFADCVTCDEELNHAMFALNCRIPGISTAMVCMCHTTQGKEEDEEFEIWEKHINKSVDFEVYDREVMKSRIFQHFLGESFTFTSYHCYKDCKINLIGVSRDNRMMINPGSNFFLREDDIMYYISEEDEDDLPDLHKLARKNFHLSSTDQNENAEPLPIVHVKNSSRPVKSFPLSNDLKEEPSDFNDGMNTKPNYLVDFPPFCPVIDRCALHVICYLTADYASDINTIKERTIYRSEVFAGKKLKHENARKPIIIISEAKLTMSIFNLITHLRAVHNTQGTFENPMLNPIIFLTPSQPDDAILRGIHRFPDIYYHLGVCTNVEDLLYINALNAEVLIYFNEPQAEQVIEEHAQLQEILFDRSQIINILHLEHLFPKIRLLACLTFSGNLKFLESDPEAIVANEFGNAMFHSRKSQEMLMSQLSMENDYMAKTMNRRMSMAPSSVMGRPSNLTTKMNLNVRNDSTDNDLSLSPSFVERVKEQVNFSLTDIIKPDASGKKDIEHNHLRYLFKESFASGKSFTMSMFDTLLYQSFNKPYLPELLKLMLGLTYSISSGKLSIYRISHEKDVGITYDQLYKRLCGADQCDRPSTNQTQTRGFLSTMGKPPSISNNKNKAAHNSLHGFSGTGVPIGLYRAKGSLRASMNQQANNRHKQNNKNQLRTTRIQSRNFDAILADESQKSERQLIDEYLDKRTKELFGENGERLEINSFGGTGGWDVNSGYIILSPDADLQMCKGDIVYVLKAHENIEEAMHP